MYDYHIDDAGFVYGANECIVALTVMTYGDAHEVLWLRECLTIHRMGLIALTGRPENLTAFYGKKAQIAIVSGSTGQDQGQR